MLMLKIFTKLDIFILSNLKVQYLNMFRIWSFSRQFLDITRKRPENLTIIYGLRSFEIVKYISYLCLSQ
jgi:hypothetical protein